MALEVRLLHRSDVAEVQEYFSSGQKGSSAMPHKRNPILSERLCGMSRILRSYVSVALENCALWHERDISHSSVERINIPDAFHLSFYMLSLANKLISNLIINKEQMLHNLNASKGLVHSQSVLSYLINQGFTRQKAYEICQQASSKVLDGTHETFKKSLENNQELKNMVELDTLNSLCSYDKTFKYLEILFKRAGIE